jgi:hypothetical protein
MANFTKIFGLAGALVVCAGLASAQDTCTANAPATNIVRNEGTTELIASMVISCTGTSAQGSASLQVFLSPSLPITSKVFSTSTNSTEAVAIVSGSATQVNGTVSGSTINFSGIAVPALAPGTFTITVSNIRVNVTSLSVGTGVPPTISATAFLNGSVGSLTPVALSFSNVAFVQNGLGTAKTYKTFTVTNPQAPAAQVAFPNGVASSSGANSFVICNSYSPKADGVNMSPAQSNAAATSAVAGKSLAFVVQINENFAASFKKAADEASQVATTAASNAVVDGTRLTITFANVPANVTLYTPIGPINSQVGGGQIQATASAAGTAFAVVTASGSSSVTGLTGVAAVAISSGTGSVTYEVTADDLNNLDSYNVPVFIVTSSNAVAGSSTAITSSVSFSPVGSTAIPNFAILGSTTTLTESTFNLCTTSLLFPFVTNQVGFDTGLAISNTSTDPFGSNGATAQAGTCTLNFYGSGAPSPSNVVTANVPSGTTYTGVLSGLAAGFQGYIIAQCGFQYAHGFAFITDGVGVTGGLSQGYLAGVIPDVNQLARAANPLSLATAGTGETLGN